MTLPATVGEDCSVLHLYTWYPERRIYAIRELRVEDSAWLRAVLRVAGKSGPQFSVYAEVTCLQSGIQRDFIVELYPSGFEPGYLHRCEPRLLAHVALEEIRGYLSSSGVPRGQCRWFDPVILRMR